MHSITKFCISKETSDWSCYWIQLNTQHKVLFEVREASYQDDVGHDKHEAIEVSLEEGDGVDGVPIQDWLQTLIFQESLHNLSVHVSL